MPGRKGTGDSPSSMLRGLGQLHGGDGLGDSCWLQAAPCAPLTCAIVLLHGPGHFPAVDIKDVDSRGDAVEKDSTHLLVPAAGTPDTLVVPGMALASPRYGSAQARSPALGVSPPRWCWYRESNTPCGMSPFWQVWMMSQGDVWGMGTTPCKAGEVAEAFSPVN